MTPDQARDRTQRQLWDLMNAISLRRQTSVLDLESWVVQLDQIRSDLAEAAWKLTQSK